MNAADTLRVIVVDDEPLIREGLAAMLAAEPGVEVVAMCASADEALERTHALAPDVLFLDVQMPGLSGIELARALVSDDAAGRDAPAFVFATAHGQYALDAFEVSAIDYLLKPFDASRVREAVRRVRARRGAVTGGPASPSDPLALAAQLADLASRLASEQRGPTWAERLVVSIPHGHRVVATRDIEWIAAADNYVTVHAADGAGLLREPLKVLEARLDPARFVRVHRSALVNLARVRELRPTSTGDWTLVMRSGATVALSRTHRDEVLRRLRER
jgi:two-component system LytT family response regulator